VLRLRESRLLGWVKSAQVRAGRWRSPVPIAWWSRIIAKVAPSHAVVAIPPHWNVSFPSYRHLPKWVLAVLFQRRRSNHVVAAEIRRLITSQRRLTR
jgi:hypothetical protein